MERVAEFNRIRRFNRDAQPLQRRLREARKAAQIARMVERNREAAKCIFCGAVGHHWTH